MIIPGYTPSHFFKHEAPTDAPGGTGGNASAELAQFKALGLSPAQIDEVLEDYIRLAKGDGGSKETPAKEKSTKAASPTKVAFDNEDNARETLLKLFPGLGKIDELDTRSKDTAEKTAKLHRSDVNSTQEASRREVLRYVTGTLGADVESAVGQKFLNTVLRIANDRLTGNVDSLQAFLDGDKAVVKSILKDMSDDGIFESMQIPKAKTRGALPFLSGSDGGSPALKAKLESDRERYSKLAPNRRWMEMSKDVFDDVFHD